MLEIEPSWAAAIADWVDIDGEPGFPDGAEDSVYTSLTPPHRAANMTITRASELMVLNGFGAERYAKLAPLRHRACRSARSSMSARRSGDRARLARANASASSALSPEDLAKRRNGRVLSRHSTTLHGKLADEQNTTRVEELAHRIE